MKSNKAIFFFACSLCFMIMSCKDTSDKTNLKLAHGLSTDHPVHIALEYMVERISELSEGNLIIDIYPAEQLGAEHELIELVQIGSIAITKVSAASLQSFADEYKVFGLPYIFRSKKHFFNVIDSDIGQDLLLSSEDKWIRGLCYYDSGSRSFYTKDKPITHPDDLGGLKIRVMPSATAVEMVRALGGSATPISWGELYTALQSGVVDGAENNTTSLYKSHHFEVCKFYSMDEHTIVPDVVVIGKKVWDSLNNQQKEWIQQAANESAILQRELWEASEIESLEKVQEAGVKVNYPDKDPFIERVQPLIESYRDNQLIYSYIQRIQAVE